MRTVIALALAALPGAAFAGSIEGKVTAPGRGDLPLVVYVEEGGKAESAVDVPAKERVRIGQKQTRFAPSAVVVPMGAKVDFPNYDKIYHNVFSLTPGNEFDLGLYRGGVSKAATFAQPGEVDVYCNIHPEMHARVLVVPSKRYVEVGEDGSFTLADVPAGTWTVVAWSPEHEPESRKVTVKNGAAKVDFSLKERRFPNTPHLNKTGEQYGRYR